MPTRWVLHEDAAGRVDTRPLLRHLTDDVADVMRQLAPVDEGDMVSTIRPMLVETGGDPKGRVSVGGMPGKVTGKPVDYPRFVELGTSKMSAQPFMRPALFRYRTGGRLS